METIAFLSVTGMSGIFMVYAFVRFYLEAERLKHPAPPETARLYRRQIPAVNFSTERKVLDEAVRPHTVSL